MVVRKLERPVAQRRLETLVRGILEENILFSLATVTPQGAAYANTACFAFTPRFELVHFSDAASTHSRNLAARPTAAATVFDSRQRWGDDHRGLQLFGACRETRGRDRDDAEALYARRFPQYVESEEPEDEQWRRSFRFYRFRPRRIKLFDEATFGEATLVTADVKDGRLRWRATEELTA